MLEGGAGVRFIQEMLGNSNLKSTQIYTQVSILKLQEIHAATHPSAKRGRQESNDGDEEPGASISPLLPPVAVTMPTLKATVSGGQAIIDIVDYPDGTELEIAIVGNDQMSDKEHAELDADIEAPFEHLAAGLTKPAT